MMEGDDNSVGEGRGNGEILVVALVADLIFASRIRGAAAAAAVEVSTVGNAEELERLVRGRRPRLVLIDLDARVGDVPGLIATLRADPGPPHFELIAFGSHLEQERLLAAREAGADRVMARSGFVRELPQILQRLRSSPP